MGYKDAEILESNIRLKEKYFEDLSITFVSYTSLGLIFDLDYKIR